MNEPDVKQRAPLEEDNTADANRIVTPIPCVRSDELLGNGGALVIKHANAHYYLRITRANKLILTK